MLALLAVLALVLYACSGAGSGNKHPNGSGRTGATVTARSSTPTIGGNSSTASGGATATSGVTSSSPSASGGPSGSPGASGSAGSAGGTGGTGGASSGASGGATGGASGGATGGASGGAATGGASGGTGGASGLPASNGNSGCQLTLTLTSQSPAYANGDQPAFTVSVLNKGTADCDVDLGPKSLMLNVFSGSDRIWSSADCTTGGADLRDISPGDVQTVTYTWNRIRSAPGCPAGGQPAKLGIYYGVVTLAAGTNAAAPAAQSQPKTFELKSGS
ncbi:MAG: hypothetical protein ACJ786_32305 [Catenulispora sp.]